MYRVTKKYKWVIEVLRYWGVATLQSRPKLKNEYNFLSQSGSLCDVVYLLNKIWLNILLGGAKWPFLLQKMSNRKTHWYFIRVQIIMHCLQFTYYRENTNKKLKYRRIVENLKPHNNGICQSFTEEHISENIRKDFKLDNYYFQNWFWSLKKLK